MHRGKSRAGAGILSETIETARFGPRELLIRPERYGFFDKLLFAVFVLAVPPFVASNWSVFRDGDVSWHVAAGRWIMEHGRVPKTDPFSFTMAGQPWVAHEWLGEIIYAIGYDLAGHAGLASVVTLTLMGKTSFMMNIAESIAIPDRNGQPRGSSGRLYSVGVFSLEMSKEQIGLRMLSSESGVSNHLIRAGMLSERNWRELAEASARLSKAKIYIDDTPGIDIMEMRAKARRLKMEAALDIVMVDYLQLMSVKGKVESRNQEISQISRGLKAIAKELNVPLISLSQLSRRPEQRTGDHRPQLSDLRESGSIEQDADVVCFIYRDEVYNKETEEKGIAEIIIGKQRNGPIGDFKLVFRNDITKFFNYEPQPEMLPA